MRIGSLFSGIGGLELGLERAGVGHTVWQVEIDPFCRKVLAQHWPGAERFEDVTKFQGRPADLICGGFPCQDISSAGNREGITGARSSLWIEFARIIGLVRPRLVVVENVSALLIRGMGNVLGDLATLGYDAIWDCIPAQAIGAPHRRDRIFVVAWRIPNTERNGIRDEPERGRSPTLAPNSGNPFTVALGKEMADTYGDGSQGRLPASHKGREDAGDGSAELADTEGCRGEQDEQGFIGQRQAAREGRKQSRTRAGRGDSGGGSAVRAQVSRRDTAPLSGSLYESPRWPPSPDDLHAWGGVQADAQPSFCRMADGLPKGIHRDRRKRLKALGNSVVPQVAEVIGHVINELGIT